MELRHLRYFIAVAEAGSFSAAAAEIRIAQPALSVAIGQLESEFGATFFVRGARGVRLTPAGRHFLDDAYRVVEDVDSMRQRFRSFTSGQTGRIRLAAVPALIWSRVPGLLREFAREHPDVDVHLSDPPPLGAIEMLLARTADIALIMTADNRRLSAGYRGVLRFVPWGELELAAVFPSADAPPPTVDLSVLRDRILYVPRRVIGVPSLAEVIDDALTQRGVEPREIRASASSIPMTLPLVAAGLGVAILPVPLLGDAVPSGVAVARIDPPLRALELAAVWREGEESGPAVEAMKAVLEAGESVER